ncbi:cyclase/dehydrase [Aphelenchoides avenae]|nr:cyclase/dehydrase [Aphelenchus avenae]
MKSGRSVIILAQRRNFFKFGSAKRENRVMKYAEKRIIGFTPEQMFDVVNTVAEYPKFVPYCSGVQMRKISDRVTEADLQIGFPPIKEEYTSKVTTLPPYVVHSVCTEGRIFHILDTTWRFGPAPDNYPQGSCLLYYTLEFEFKSKLHARMATMFFGQIVRKMVCAFLCRAEKLYGKPSFDHFALKPEILSHNY